MADFTEALLTEVDRTGDVDTLSLAKKLDIDHQKLVGAVKSLQSLGDIITAQPIQNTFLQLTEEGKDIALHGSHEALVFQGVPDAGISQAELMERVPNAKIGFNKAMSAGWICIEKTVNEQQIIRRKVKTIEDSVQEHLKKISDRSLAGISDAQIAEYKKRKLIVEVNLTSYQIQKGRNFTLTVSKADADLTPQMILSGSWKTTEFKPYNFDSMGMPPECGHLHPLLKVRTEYRKIFLEMGFQEMPTNNFIESSFWNFDTLFVPQKHPARDIQDTFFISDPQNAKSFPMDYLEKVKRVHQGGDFGSKGYQCEWKIEETKKNLLRTHTTAVSARMLYNLAQKKPFKPVKYFSIDRVFRNESLDATHLAEFHQIEGLVADHGLTLGDLKGVINEFFQKLGIKKLRFKPAYNPYTEPSMEIFGHHEGLNKWVEVGNSGVFRPEMLLPMGLPEDVSIIAWGLSLERPTMIKYNVNNIRDLFGPKVNLQMVYDNPMCRLDK